MYTFVHLSNASFELFHNISLITLYKTLQGTNRIISQIHLLYTNVIKSSNQIRS